MSLFSVMLIHMCLELMTWDWRAYPWRNLVLPLSADIGWPIGIHVRIDPVRLLQSPSAGVVTIQIFL